MQSKNLNQKRLFIGITIAIIVIGAVVATVVLVLKNQSKSNSSEPVVGSSNNTQIKVIDANLNSINPPTETTSTTTTTATPVPTQNPNHCTNPRLRKEWRELSTSEQSRFMNAVQALKRSPSQMGTSNRYEDFVAIHTQFKDVAHGTSQFFPWHRKYLLDFENALRQIDSSVTLPYWDEGLDSQNPASSPIFNSNAFGSDGIGSDNCVQSGTFAGWTTYYPSPHCLKRNFNGGSGQILNWASSEQFAAIVLSNSDYASFRAVFEVNAHNAIHVAIGGDMSQMISPNDPIFFIHHANVDRYFDIWQKEYPNGQYNGGSFSDNMAPYNIPVSSAWDSLSHENCYTYSSSVGPNTSQRLFKKQVGESGENGLKLKYPTPIPKEFAEKMGFDYAIVEKYQAQMKKLTDELNKSNYISPCVVSSRLIKDHPHWSKVQSKIWRFEKGGKNREYIAKALSG